MDYVILLGCLVPTFFIRRQVVYWRTISIFGFSIDTPEGYIRHPSVYNCVSWLLVFGLFVVVSWFTEFSLYIRVVLFPILILVAEMEGKLKATEQYRRNLREMLEEDDLDAEQREKIWSDLSKSTSQLLEEKRRIHRLMSRCR